MSSQDEKQTLNQHFINLVLLQKIEILTFDSGMRATWKNKIASIFIREYSLCFLFAVIFSISRGEKERSLFYYVNHFIYKEVIDELSDFCIQMIPLN